MRSSSRLPAFTAVLTLTLALGATTSRPAVSPSPRTGNGALPATGETLSTAAGTAPEAAPLLTCSDCINICLLRHCGFLEPPACVSANLPGCRAQCASSCG
jgi:hypothetical protein